MSRDTPLHVDGPIGILDSGIGGLTVWREIIHALTQESTIYIGDHAYLPYGLRTQEDIRLRVKFLINFFVKKGTKLVVIACNTATVAGIDQYRAWYPHTPIIGVVPVIKTAAALTRTKHIAVLSTPSTAKSTYQKHLIETFAAGCQIEAIGIPDLPELIESGATNKMIDALLKKFLNLEKLRGVDVIVLGCTHYPFITQRIQQMVGKNVAIIDSGAAVARHVVRVLSAEKLLRSHGSPYTEFYTTGNASRVSRVAATWTGFSCPFTYEQI